jgi:hypothetical protein
MWGRAPPLPLPCALLTEAVHVSGEPGLKSLWLASLAAICFLSQPVLARGDVGAAVGIRRTPELSEGDDAAERALSARIESLIQMRLAMVEHVAPRPSAGETNPAVMMMHLAALNELSDFSAQTVLGLVDAAADDDTRKRLAAALAPVVARHERDIAAAFADLRAHPLGRDNSLLKRAEIADQTSQRRVLAKLQALATQRETRLDSLQPALPNPAVNHR